MNARDSTLHLNGKPLLTTIFTDSATLSNIRKWRLLFPAASRTSTHTKSSSLLDQRVFVARDYDEYHKVNPRYQCMSI